MEYGYVCFAYSKNELTAKAIARVTKSQWSHSFITIPNMLGKQMAMEAASNGVNTVLFDDSYRNNPNQKYEVYRVICDDAATDQAILACMGQLEVGYGYLHYPWFIWRAINQLFGRDIKSQNNWSSKGDVCSDLTRLRLEAGGFKNLFSGFGIDSANAQDIYEIVKSNPNIFQLIESKN